MRAELCAECGRPALLQPHPYLAIGTGKPPSFAPLMVCRECFPARFEYSPAVGDYSFPARRSTREQMTLFGSAVR